jgi:hypothetical protein
MPTYVVGDVHLTDWSIGMQQDADFADPRHGRRREVGSNPRSRAKRTTARHCFLVPSRNHSSARHAANRASSIPG